MSVMQSWAVIGLLYFPHSLLLNFWLWPVAAVAAVQMTLAAVVAVQAVFCMVLPSQLQPVQTTQLR